MIRALVLALLIACGGGGTKKLHVDYAFVPEPEHSGIVRGIIITDSGQPAIGATAIIELPNKQEVAQITDENGNFTMPQALPDGHYDLQVFFGNSKAVYTIEVRTGHVTVVRITNLREPTGELL